MKPIISTKNITKKFDHEVLSGLDLDIFHGEIMAIIGASGAGKSTFLNILGLLDRPDSGNIIYSGRDSKFSGRDLTTLSQKYKSLIRNLHFGFIFQLYHLLPALTMLENIMLPKLISAGLLNWRTIKKESHKKATELVEELGISHRIKAHPSELSGGEKQRVAIARALITEPEIVFCDEPTGNLDSETSNKIHKLLWRLNKKHNTTFIIVTHEKELAKNADRMLNIVDGKFK